MKLNARLMNLGIVALAVVMVAGLQSIVSARNARALSSESQHPTYACSVKVPEPEPKDLSSLAKIKADAAIGAALTANPGTTATEVKLENENGCLVYTVNLNNGQEVAVDAGKGTVIHSRPTAAHEEESEHQEAGKSED